ncbi:MAG: hypothetical protein ACON4F_07475 [Candidatus Puniceispirillaceae bacterium]
MKRYLIIIAALLAAWLVVNIMAYWRKKSGAERDPTIDWLVAALVAIGLMLGGFVWLEQSASDAFSTYQPAVIEDGQIKGPVFNTDDTK